DHADVAGAGGAQALDDPGREQQVGAGEDRQPDHVDVLLDRLGDDLLRRALEPGVDDLEAGVAQGLGDDLRPAVVAVQPRLGEEDLHAGISSVASTPVTRAPSTTMWPTEIGRRNRRGPALPGLKKSTPSRSSERGWWLWPAITAENPAARGSRSSSLTS